MRLIFDLVCVCVVIKGWVVVRRISYHCLHLARQHSGLSWGDAHLLHERILEGQVIASVYEQLVLQVLWWMEIFARGLFAVAASLEARKGGLQIN